MAIGEIVLLLFPCESHQPCLSLSSRLWRHSQTKLYRNNGKSRVALSRKAVYSEIHPCLGREVFRPIAYKYFSGWTLNLY